MVDRDAFKTLDVALRVGELLLANGAGAADVTATMQAVTRACGLRGVSVDVTFTELTLNHQPTHDDPGLVQKRSVRHREIDYEDLTLVDHIVRALLAGDIDRDDARARLARLNAHGHRRPAWAVTLGWGVMGAGTAALLGGGVIVGTLAFVAAMGIDRIQRAMSVRELPSFYQQVAGGLLASLLAVAAVAVGLPVTPAEVITTGIIMLLSGLGLVGAAQDALTGFPVTANARILEATLATVGIIAGVSGGLTVGDVIGVDLGSLRPAGPDLSDLPVVVAGAAVAAAAFAFAAYAPLRALAADRAGGRAGPGRRGAHERRDFGATWAAATAAVLIGAVSYSAAGRIRVPPSSWSSRPWCRCCPASPSTPACSTSPTVVAAPCRSSPRWRPRSRSPPARSWVSTSPSRCDAADAAWSPGSPAPGWSAPSGSVPWRHGGGHNEAHD